VVDGLNVSAGQSADVPVQVSLLSHGPVAAWHTKVDGWNMSAGHCADVPVQLSAMSHGPAEG
jgi:hypothetical protein